MANGRREEAIEFLVKYHGGGDPSSKLVELEIREFTESIVQDGADKRWWDCQFAIYLITQPTAQTDQIAPFS